MKKARAVWVALFAITFLLLAVAGAAGQTRTRSTASRAAVAQPQPLFSEYKGIRLGMSAEEVRAKLGEPTMKFEDQDYYIFSHTESAQFAYNNTQQVVTISIDYTGPGAPDYRNVVGEQIDENEDGSLHKILRYEAQRFWVSYSRTAGTSPIVTVTIQKM